MHEWHFFNFLFDLGKLNLPRINHANFHKEIRIESVICALITRWLHLKPPLEDQTNDRQQIYSFNSFNI